MPNVFYSTSPALWLIPAMPAMAALIIFVFSNLIRARAAGWIASIGVGLAFIWTLVTFCAFYSVRDTGVHFLQQTYWQWLNAGFVKANAGFLFDHISGIFALVITGVGFLIHVFSTSYMEEEEGQRRYFGFLSLFVASMLVLVLADNAFFMFLGWEGVGACSFALIGHYYQKRENVYAALKAFFVTRFGDVFLVLGVLLLSWIGTVEFTQLNYIFSDVDLNAIHPHLQVSAGSLIMIGGFLLLGGALGKSAQLPLQTWLPDAMAGPTPVSALIHAATMVTAGIYLIARFHVVFALSPTLMLVVAIIGALTALYGATCAIVQSDIKRILAFSTISQIGYMMLALGVGAFSLGVFHFFTHAFFKALLFLAAGSVIHSMHGEQNIFKMGGLRKELPGVFLATVAGAIALAGIPLTSGFFSKDAILWSTLTTDNGNIILYIIGLVTAFLTAVYSARLIYVVFLGEARHSVHVHVPGIRQKGPLYVLAVFALFTGFLNIPGLLNWEHFYHAHFGEWISEPSHNLSMELVMAAVSGILAILGWFLGATLFGSKRIEAGKILPAPAMDPTEIQIASPAPYKSGLANFLYRAWDFDRLYGAVIQGPYRSTSKVLAWLDEYLVDGIYEAGSVILQLFHGFFVTLQNARTGRYAAMMLLGAAVIAVIVAVCGQGTL